ncbi:rhodanese-like domain-containing protein [Haloferula sp. A504]|uniref:rhodanese-like domain-containing protein n=1 Tax=Haloferula sp. A504 TaxID=3373601 RepID=UPI0031C4CDE3|nr:rhodanese-like domain-containing protein [Verrucomicrobiaceae bacterium E54]
MLRLVPLLALALSACAPATNAPQKVKVAEAATLIAEEKVQLLDVRTEEEWNEGRIEGATRIEIGSKDFAKTVKESFDESKPLLVYCRSGRRSERATRQLRDAGFPVLYDLKGGIRSWTNDGQKVVK